jgi:glutamate/aspartate transport system substrate-binding protein
MIWWKNRGVIMVRIAFALIALVLTAGIASSQGADGRLNTVNKTNTIKIAYRTDAAPFSYLNENKEPAGYTVDLCKLVVLRLEKQLGVQALEIQWVPVTTQTRFDAVANGIADMECGASTVTLGRMKQVDFSSFVFVESTGLVVKRESNIRSLIDLAGKKIAVIAGTSNERAVSEKNQQQNLNFRIVQVTDRNEGIAALEGGRADAFASDKLLLVGAQFNNPQAMIMLPDDLSMEPYAIVVPRGDWALRLAVNTALARIYGSGEIMAIFNKWFSPLGLRPSLLLGAAYALGTLPE